MQFTQLLSEYEKYITFTKGNAKRTIKNKLRRVEYLLNYLTANSITMMQFDLKHYTTLCQQTRKRPRPKNSCKHEGELITHNSFRNIVMTYRGFVRRAYGVGICGLNDRLIVIPKMKEEIIKEPYKERQMKAIFEAPDKYQESEIRRLRDKLAIRIFYYTGIRVSALVTLKNSDILDCENGTVHIISKGSNYRTIFFDQTTIELGKAYIKMKCEYGIKSVYLFCGHRQNKINTRLTTYGARSIFKKYRDKLGFLASPHGFRRTFGTNLSENGVKFEVIVSLMGHSSPVSTKRYITINTDRNREALAGLAPY